jgi:adhesin transport system outer membrane protein
MIRSTISLVAAALLATASSSAVAQSTDGVVSLNDAVTAAMQSNPEILQAQMNTEAIQFEREQAQGQYYPRLNLEASAGARRLENATRRALKISNDWLYPLEADATADMTLIDFGRRRGELLRQAARVDGASLRVVERSQFIALQVARQYMNVLLQQRISAAAQDNVTFHQSLVNDLAEGVKQGSISVADQQQAEERLQAALVRQDEAMQDLTDAKIELRRLTGLQIDTVSLPPVLAARVPPSEDAAIGLARTANPLVREAQADVDAAEAVVTSAKGDLYPTIGVDLTGRIGEDIDGFKGQTNDVQGRLYMRWNVFDGGINRAKVQETVRQASQARFKLYEVIRQAEGDVANAWNARTSQDAITKKLDRESQVSDDLLLSYRSQFNVGRRSLLDVLDAENTRFNTQVRLETARFSQMFAEYQILAATDQLLEALNVQPGAGAGANERERFNYGPPVPAELQRRRYPG